MYVASFTVKLHKARLMGVGHTPNAESGQYSKHGNTRRTFPKSAPRGIPNTACGMRYTFHNGTLRAVHIVSNSLLKERKDSPPLVHSVIPQSSHSVMMQAASWVMIIVMEAFQYLTQYNNRPSEQGNMIEMQHAQLCSETCL